MSRITLLGTGTCQIEHERRASSVLLELDGLLILFDCGHGVSQRLLEAGISHDKLNHIVLSHFRANGPFRAVQLHAAIVCGARA